MPGSPFHPQLNFNNLSGPHIETSIENPALRIGAEPTRDGSGLRPGGPHYARWRREGPIDTNRRLIHLLPKSRCELRWSDAKGSAKPLGKVALIDITHRRRHRCAGSPFNNNWLVCITVTAAVDFAWLLFGVALRSIQLSARAERAINIYMGASILVALGMTLI